MVKKIIFIDSDGTVMDSMTLKHERCFGPALIETYHLENYKVDILHKWDIINLYSLTRGINRFDGHYAILKYINEKYQKISFLENFKEWLDNTSAKANQNLADYIAAGHAELKPVLDWSILINKKIVEEQENVKPFEAVLKAMPNLAKKFKLVIISSANNKAVMHEWEKFDLLPLVSEVCTQEMGSKAECIKKTLAKEQGIEAIMLGDALGDLEAATKNGISFYPIVPRFEDKSWLDFLNNYSEKFYEGTYKQVEKELINKFIKVLEEEN